MVTTSIYGQSQLPSNWNSAELSVVRAFDLVRTNITDGTPMPLWTADGYSFLPVVLQNSAQSSGIYQVSTLGIGAKLTCDQYDAPGINQQWGTIWNYTIPSLQNSSDVQCSLQARAIWNPYAQYRQAIMFKAPRKEDFQSGYNNPGFSADDSPSFFDTLNICRGRSMVITEWWGNVTSNVEAGKTTNNTALVCQPEIEAQSFNVTVDQHGLVQSYQISGSNEGGDPSTFFQNMPDFLATYQASFSEAAYQSTNAGDESYPYDWPGLLTARFHWITASETSSLEDNAVLGDYASRLYARTFSHWFSLYRDRLLQKTATPIAQAGTVTSPQARMVPSRPFFVIAFALLGLQLCGCVAIYAFRRERCSGPRMPKSLGSILPWVVHSRMLDDFKDLRQHASSEELDRMLENMGKRYAFGKFVDEKGSVRLGIEEDGFGEKEGLEMETLDPVT